jgi:threonine dehydratase
MTVQPAAPEYASLTPDVFTEARRRIAGKVHHTPLIQSRTLSRATGFEVWLKAELFQRTGSYKIRGPSNKLPQLTDEQRDRGVVCSSAGNHAQGVALAAATLGVRAVVVMARGATPAKVEATRGYGAEVIQHGEIWDEANAHALELAAEQGLTMIHPFDDAQLIAGQGTVGVEIHEDLPDVEAVVVPIGGGGLISGTSTALKGLRQDIQVFGVESSGAPAMKRSVEAGQVVTLGEMDCAIDGLKVKRVGDLTFELARRNVDRFLALPDREIFDAVLWTMSTCKLVVEGAAAAPVAALRAGLVDVPKGSKVVCVISGGNLDLEVLRGRTLN